MGETATALSNTRFLNMAPTRGLLCAMLASATAASCEGMTPPEGPTWTWWMPADEAVDSDPAGRPATGPRACSGHPDGAVDHGETCDDGNEVDWDGCSGCRITEFMLSARTAESQSSPAVGLSEDGSLIAAWIGDRPGAAGRAVFTRSWDGGGSPSGHEIQLEGSGYLYHPDVALAPDGASAVAFWGGGGTMLALFDPDGLPVGPLLDLDDFYNQTLESAGPGRFVMAGDTGFEGSVAALVITTDPVDVVVAGPISNGRRLHYPETHAAAMPGGRFVVSWTSTAMYPCEVDNTSLWAQVFEPDGSAAGPAFSITETCVHDGLFAHAVAITPDGNLAVAWLWRTMPMLIHHATFSDDGVQLDYGEIPCSLITDDSLQFGDMDIASDGRILVVVLEGESIMMASYGPDRAPVASSVELGSGWRAYSRGDLSLEVLPGGRTVVAWDTMEQDGDSLGVFAQRVGADGAPIGLDPW